ncbi:hypothetical protein [Nocardia flavorosea]|uniref:Uncharacterized protein n=1 Tax=Nocardia flavorosea TaxID=53429 RepID=A0A846YS82_9NOCA|nr:hypothetical protein [Nocardia flavorosea]NKY60410.1 hypothetical protein [Nocardia flavorosea]
MGEPSEGWQRDDIPDLIAALELVESFQAVTDHLATRGVQDPAKWGVERYERDAFGGWDWFTVDQHELNEVRAVMESIAA